MASKVEVNTKKLNSILRNLSGNRDEALRKLAFDIVSLAKQKAPVDTGALRGSINNEKLGKGQVVFVGVEYGAFVEFGTTRQGAQPYFVPAIREVEKDLKKTFKKVATDGE